MLSFIGFTEGNRTNLTDLIYIRNKNKYSGINHFDSYTQIPTQIPTPSPSITLPPPKNTLGIVAIVLVGIGILIFTIFVIYPVVTKLKKRRRESRAILDWSSLWTFEQRVVVEDDDESTLVVNSAEIKVNLSQIYSLVRIKFN